MGRSVLGVQRGVPLQRSLERGTQVQGEKKVEGQRAGGKTKGQKRDEGTGGKEKVGGRVRGT